MDRKDFLRSLGLSAGSLVLATCMGGCSKSDNDEPDAPIPDPNTKVDFTFDTTSDANLVSNGWTIRNGVIIAKSGTAYLAYESVCPHQGFNLTYNSGSNTFPCSQTGAAHGSVFDAEGKRTAGPAPRNLKKYSTEVNGNMLRIFE